jgi:hypothetical protein
MCLISAGMQVCGRFVLNQIDKHLSEFTQADKHLSQFTRADKHLSEFVEEPGGILYAVVVCDR